MQMTKKNLKIVKLTIGDWLQRKEQNFTFDLTYIYGPTGSIKQAFKYVKLKSKDINLQIYH